MIKITRLSSPEDPITRLRVEGRVVLHTVGELVRAAENVLGDDGPVLLDFGGVGYVDAEGASAIAALCRRNVTLIGCSPFVGALLRSHAEHEDGTAPTAADERRLVAQLRRHEPEAFEAMVRRYGSRMLAVARHMLRYEDDARAAVQEAVLTAADSVASFRDGADLSTWLRGFVAKAALMRQRTRRRTAEESLDALLPRFDETGHWAKRVPAMALPGDVYERGETRAAVARCLDRLPESFRTTLVLRDLEGFTAADVAALVGTTPGAVRSRTHLARQALHTVLTRELRTDAATQRDGDNRGATGSPIRAD
jgi:RNA polymerase sigma-70 factor, ECF subfamily